MGHPGPLSCGSLHSLILALLATLQLLQHLPAVGLSLLPLSHLFQQQLLVLTQLVPQQL